MCEGFSYKIYLKWGISLVSLQIYIHHFVKIVKSYIAHKLCRGAISSILFKYVYILFNDYVSEELRIELRTLLNRVSFSPLDVSWGFTTKYYCSWSRISSEPPMWILSHVYKIILTNIKIWTEIEVTGKYFYNLIGRYSWK